MNKEWKLVPGVQYVAISQARIARAVPLYRLEGYYCGECSNTNTLYPSLPALRRHMTHEHCCSWCHICKINVPNSFKNSHSAIFHGKMTFSCLFCEMIYISLDELYGHHCTNDLVREVQSVLRNSIN